MRTQAPPTDFKWVGSDEPHATRRNIILSKYPQIKKLMSVDPNFKWTVLGLILVQFSVFYSLKGVESFWTLFLVSYCVVGTINHSLMLALHEISHGQAFSGSHVLANKLFGILVNMPLGYPLSLTFKKYHLPHHRYLGVDMVDADSPSKFETTWITTSFRKFIWIVAQPVFYIGFRPFSVELLKFDSLEVASYVIQVCFNAFVAVTCGWRVLLVALGGSLMSLSLHPLAYHFISEHFLMTACEDESECLSNNNAIDGVSLSDGKMNVPETSSYYGYLNYITFNVGYHVEHHDFPSIPGSRLPQVRKIASEFYDNLPHHTSWFSVFYRFVMDPSVGPFARVKRTRKVSKNKEH